MVELKSEALGPCQWEAGYAGMSWEGDCKGIGVSWSPAQMIASTDQGLQPASPSQAGSGVLQKPPAVQEEEQDAWSWWWDGRNVRSA